MPQAGIHLVNLRLPAELHRQFKALVPPRMVNAAIVSMVESYVEQSGKTSEATQDGE